MSASASARLRHPLCAIVLYTGLHDSGDAPLGDTEASLLAPRPPGGLVAQEGGLLYAASTLCEEMPLIIPKKFLPLPSPGEFFEGRHQQVYLLPGIVKRQACPYRSIGKPETLDERLAAVVAGPHHDVCRLIEPAGPLRGDGNHRR